MEIFLAEGFWIYNENGKNFFAAAGKALKKCVLFIAVE